MTMPDEVARSHDLGEAAIEQLKRNAIAAYPRYYEFWYTYSAGVNRALNKAVNEALRQRGSISTDEIDAIYDRVLSQARLGDLIDEVGSQVSSRMNDILELLGRSVLATSAYSDSLAGASSALSATADPQHVLAIIADLVRTTQVTEVTNRQLEAQLAESRRQVAELKDSLELVRHESMTDDLTTLGNRKLFDRALDRALARAAEAGEPFCLLITDIDHFKAFNDTYGHPTGDQVLRLVALTAKTALRPEDTACRYGGEEFAIVLPRLDLSAAREVAERIRNAVGAKELLKRSTGETLGHITLSIGIAECRGGDTPQTVIGRADDALYTAKQSGRNRVRAESDPGIRRAHVA